MGNKTHKQDNMILPVLLVQDVFVSLNDHLNYLISDHDKMKVCLNKKEEFDKAVLESKISLLTERVYKLKRQLDKRKDNER